MVNRVVGLYYAIAVFFMGCGFYKMFIYKGSESTTSLTADTAKTINAYVGGDAYNYIINTEMAVAFFVLALIFVIMASVSSILNKMDENKKVEVQ